jgi:hypothetical protein
VLAERFGADAETDDVLEAISAYLPDIPPPRPPDMPRSILPRERLRLIRGASG